MPFLPPNQQRQSTEGICTRKHIKKYIQTCQTLQMLLITAIAYGINEFLKRVVRVRTDGYLFLVRNQDIANDFE